MKSLFIYLVYIFVIIININEILTIQLLFSLFWIINLLFIHDLVFKI